MKPFDRTKANKDNIISRDGRKAVFYLDTGLDLTCPIVVVWEHDKYCCVLAEDGTFDYYKSEHKDDALMQSEKKEVWINLYREDENIETGGFTTYSSKEDAESMVRQKSFYVDTVKIYEYEV